MLTGAPWRTCAAGASDCSIRSWQLSLTCAETGSKKSPSQALSAYHAIREVICAAAALARQDPLRISFANALDVVRGPVGSPGPFSPSAG